MENFKLFMLNLGCRPTGRFTEQHDVFFGIGKSLKDLIPEIKAFWPEAKGKIHIDAWREVNFVDAHSIKVIPKQTITNDKNLFFINLGGYKENDMEEFHYKVLAVADDLKEASKKSKETAFFKHYSLPGEGTSHIDDKYGIDVDDIYRISDILDQKYKEMYSLSITKSETDCEDPLQIGYLRLDKI